MHKLTSVTLIFVMIFSALAFLPASHARATVPTITNYGISPINAQIGTLIQVWLTYTDVDNDAPTYVRCTRTTITGFAQLQTPNTMIANNSGDTTYSDGKQYYYNWYYFPFANTGNIKMMVKSGVDAEVTKTVIEFQEPAPTLRHSGVTPLNNSVGNYTFFTNFTDVFNGVPTYVRVRIDGVNYNMGKNNSTQTSWTSGVDYNYTINFSIGNHTYEFHTASYFNKSGDQSSGVFWLIIVSEISPTDWNLIGLSLISGGSVIGLLGISLILSSKKKE